MEKSAGSKDRCQLLEAAGKRLAECLENIIRQRKDLQAINSV